MSNSTGDCAAGRKLSLLKTKALAPLLTGGAATRDRVIGTLCAVMVVFLFSSFTLVSRLGFSSSLQVIDIAAIRFSISGVVLTPVLWRYGLSGVRWREAAALAFCGGLGFALLAFTGFSLAPATHGGVLLHGTLALTTSVLAWIGLRTPTTRGRMLGLLAILAGIAAMAWDSVATSSGHQLLGDCALLLASFSWSAYGLLARQLGLSSAHTASIVTVLSMCCFMPTYLMLPGAGRTLLSAGPTELVLQGTFQGLLIGVASPFLYSRAVASLGAAETAVFTAAVPCVTVVAAIFLLGEAPSSAAILGAVIVTIGMAAALKG
jgi:drug/metabolite transporter (DMT)-like permease